MKIAILAITWVVWPELTPWLVLAMAFASLGED